jgi:nucleoside-specific outer membrane channel protein Tsx
MTSLQLMNCSAKAQYNRYNNNGYTTQPNYVSPISTGGSYSNVYRGVGNSYYGNVNGQPFTANPGVGGSFYGTSGGRAYNASPNNGGGYSIYCY